MRLKWTNPKKKNKVFEGSAVRSKVPRRQFYESTFVLSNVNKDKFETYSFESWQQAVKLGWVRSK